MMEVVRVVVAVVAAALLVWTRKGGGATARRGLVAAGVAGIALWPADVYTGLRPYHNEWDLYHYYVGAKYFAELGYTGLYRAAVAADAENGHGGELRDRIIRNHETNVVESAAQSLRTGTAPKAAFSPDRWREFRSDIAFFRRHVALERWKMMQADHGFNASPVWCLAGSALTNAFPLSIRNLTLLTVADAVLLAGIWVVMPWAFGWRAAAVAAVFWGTNHFARFGWTSASILRHDWLFLTVLSAALLKKGQPFASGVAISAAALLRVFPGILVLGVLAREAGHMWRRRSLLPTAEGRRFVAGGLFSAALLLPLATVASGRGVSVWEEFARNSRTHVSTPASNVLGLPSLISYVPERSIARLISESRARFPEGGWAQGVWIEETWVAARRQAAADRRVARIALAVFGLAGLLYVASRRAAWEALALAAGAIPIVGSLSGYYWSILLVLGTLVGVTRWTGAALLLWSAASRLWPFSFPVDEHQALLNTTLGLLVVILAALESNESPRS